MASYGSVSGAGTFADGQSATLTATPEDGYEFYRWRRADGTYIYDNPLTFTVTDNVNIRAYFRTTEVRYNVTVTNGTPGSEPYVTIAGAGQKVQGESFTLTATYTTPYNACHWYLDGVEVCSTDDYTVNNIDRDLDITIYFDYFPQPRTISVATNDANLGTVQVSCLGEQSNTSIVVYEGQQVTLTATLVDPNATFTGWYLGGTKVSDNLVYTFTLPDRSEDSTYTANFTI